MKRLLQHIKDWWTNPVTICTRSDDGDGAWCSPLFMRRRLPFLTMPDCQEFLRGPEKCTKTGLVLSYRQQRQMNKTVLTAKAERQYLNISRTGDERSVTT